MGTATLGYPGGPSIAFRLCRKTMLGKVRCMTQDSTCSHPGCKKRIKSKKLCGTHYERQRKHGDSSIVLKTGAKPGRTGELSSQWKGAAAGLDAQHKRISTVRGTPKACEHCGTTDPAKHYHWAFNNTGDRLNIWDYLRLCAGCHRRYDDAFTPRGSRHWMARLNEEDIPKIFEMRKAGSLLREIGAEFKISTTHVSDVLAGKAWGHLRGGDA